MHDEGEMTVGFDVLDADAHRAEEIDELGHGAFPHPGAAVDADWRRGENRRGDALGPAAAPPPPGKERVVHVQRRGEVSTRRGARFRP